MPTSPASPPDPPLSRLLGGPSPAALGFVHVCQVWAGPAVGQVRLGVTLGSPRCSRPPPLALGGALQIEESLSVGAHGATAMLLPCRLPLGVQLAASAGAA